MSAVGQSKELVTAYLMQDEDLISMLVGETMEPEIIGALTTLTGTFIRQLSSTIGIEPLELWTRTLNSYATHQATD